MKIESIDNNSPHFEKVKKLWRADAATLGFFPEGAFIEHASKKQILVCIDSNNQCIGYLLYRITRNSVSVVHLCVDNKHRKQGIGKALVTNLIQSTKNHLGVGLKCRRDYDVNNIWARTGFIARHEFDGKNREGNPLTFWWYDHGHPTLFTLGAQRIFESKLCVVIDANIFFDLQAQNNTDSEESKSLSADWLSETLELCLTEEIYNEIDRKEDRKERKTQRNKVQSFTILPCDNNKFEKIAVELIQLFPKKMRVQDRSDLNQIARAIASETQYFVTRDSSLLNLKDELYDRYKIAVFRPSDLIIHLDELHREAEYQPVRLAGTRITTRRVQSNEEDKLTEIFKCAQQRESGISFRRVLRNFLTDPKKYSCFVIISDINTPLALIVYGRSNDSELEIPIIRVTKNALSSTIVRCLIQKALIITAEEKRQIVRIADKYINETILTALKQDGFLEVENCWIKICLPVVGTALEISGILSELSATYKNSKIRETTLEIQDLLNAEATLGDAASMTALEKVLWPVKFVDANIPTFIVPIKPRWAMDLFDEQLAEQDLFGAKTDLALQRESVYYKAAHPLVLKSPGRILWYVSEGGSNRYSGTKKIKACSHIDEVVVDKPKKLFKRYRRLGVYEWRDIYALAKNNIDNDIAAIKFSDTELFNTPIPWEEMQSTLREHEIKSNIQSPVKISNAVFTKLYSAGKKSKGKFNVS